MRLLARVLAVNNNLIPTEYFITHAVILDDKNSRQGQDLYCIQNSLVFKRSHNQISLEPSPFCLVYNLCHGCFALGPPSLGKLAIELPDLAILSILFH